MPDEWMIMRGDGSVKHFDHYTIKIPVTFEFEVTGSEKEVMQSIHDQIRSELNEYYQPEGKRAVLRKIMIHEWRL